MNTELLIQKYGVDLANHFLDVMHDTPKHELIEELLYYMPGSVLDNIMREFNDHLLEA